MGAQADHGDDPMEDVAHDRNNRWCHGKRLRIIRGKCKSHKHCKFVDYRGKQSAMVEIRMEGDDNNDVLEKFNPMAFSAKVNEETTPAWNQAMSGPDAEGFWEGMAIEIRTLEKMEVWEVHHLHSAKQPNMSLRVLHSRVQVVMLHPQTIRHSPHQFISASQASHFNCNVGACTLYVHDSFA